MTTPERLSNQGSPATSLQQQNFAGANSFLHQHYTLKIIRLNCIFCSKDIQPDDLTQFSHGNSHVDCFKCSACNRQLK
ncbi:uncharacterized protein DEA37_0004509 [Paragonimus westermani]|uniref:LIM zinc-binding domain-containing protein n=1 Tax=Paragonimus westermani TaxID=34504 RepID=A0A5J4NXS0_9TREM|nr:uncharacterized protein DEA37_0004509 [Paragonimus westermani]